MVLTMTWSLMIDVVTTVPGNQSNFDSTLNLPNTWYVHFASTPHNFPRTIFFKKNTGQTHDRRTEVS